MNNKHNSNVSLQRAGAPRLIEWTGERCVPWAPDIQVVYEHFHRYLWARELARGLRVLDLGSGEGFGAAILSDTAEEVVGLDIDERSVTHAELNWAGNGLSFIRGTAADLSAFDADSFDLVVAFEVIEHVSEQDVVLAEVSRVLKPEGVLLSSTPDRDVYGAENPTPNPFHVKELSRREFEALLKAEFSNVRLFAQRIIEGSRIDSLEPSSSEAAKPLQIELREGEWRVAGPPSPRFLLALSSAGDLPGVPDSSTLADFDLQLMRRVEGLVGEERNRAIEARGERDHVQTQLEESQTQLELQRRQRNELLISERGDLTAKAAESARRAQLAEDTAAKSSELLERYEASISWRFFQKVRNSAIRVLGGADALSVRLAKAAFRGAHRLFGNSSPGEASGPPGSGRSDFDLPTSSSPVASIVIPVHDGAGMIRQCLNSILHSVDDVPYEVVVVDDCSDTETQAMIASIGGVRVVRNESNLGFLKSVNRGVASSRGEFVVLLNNDTEPQPGWLRSLIACAERSEEVGAVAAKLLYGDVPDHTLQEAGGIVWRDGTAWNFGNGGRHTHGEYNFTREVDYGSAAALLVRREAWEQVGGFDERFSPAYWEDTDLCFSLREAGWRVLYEPSATVIHHEGNSMGTNTSEDGGKKYQLINQPKFFEKWQRVLAAHPASPGPDRALLASNWRRSPTVFIFDHDLPQPDRDAGSLRMMNIVRTFLDRGWRVVFVPDNGSGKMPYVEDLRQIGVEVLNDDYTLGEHLAAMASDIELVILSRPYVAARYLHQVRELAPDAVIAYDTVDLHFVREGRRAESDSANRRRISGVADGFRELERALCRAADVTLVVGDHEAEIVRGLSDKPVHVVGLANHVWQEVPGPEGRDGVMFIGGFSHPPNIDAAIRLVNEVMPLVWAEAPGTFVKIVGADPPSAVKDLSSPLVEVTGWVDDIRPCLETSRVSVAPLSYGAGVKGKVTEALAAGLPVVTSVVGAEGLSDGDGLAIGEDSAEIAALTLRLLQDDEDWLSQSGLGQELALRTSSEGHQANELSALVELLPTLRPEFGNKLTASG